MRFLELQLRAIGPFTDATLDFRGGRRGLHLVYGPNEAGKSSTLRALRYLLYGFPTQLTDDFLHPYAQLRVGAVLESDSGERLSVVRRKAAKQSLRGADDAAIVDDAELRRFLGNVDAGLFGTFFGIDHPQLVEGGRSIVEGHGDVGGVLFSAAGIADLHAIQKTLDEECDALFRPQAKNPALNALLSSVREAEKKVAQCSLAPKEWEDHHLKLKELQDRKKVVDADLTERRMRQSRLDRIRKALRILPDRERWRQAVADLRDAVLLPADFRDRRQRLERDLAIQETTRRGAKESAERNAAELEGMEPPAPLLAQRDNIETKAEEVGVYRNAKRDRPALEAKLRQHEAEAAAALQELERNLTPDEAAALRVTPTQRKKIQSLGNHYQKLLAQQKSCEETVRSLSAQLEEARRDVESLPSAPDVASLQQLVTGISRQGDLEALRDAALKECQRTAAQLDLEVRRIPGYSGTSAEFVALAVPAAESVERKDGEFSAIEQEQRTLTARIEEREAELGEVAQSIDAMQRERDVPTEDDLRRQRETRDRAWQLVRQSLVGNSDNQDEIETFRQEEHLSGTLVETLPRLMEAADTTADRLRREADQVARLAQLSSRRRRVEAELQRLKSQKEECEARRAVVDAAWSALWQPTGIAPQTPREMLALLRRHGEIVQRHQLTEELRAKAEELSQRCQDSTDSLRRRLAEAQTNPPESASLAELVQIAETLIEEASQRATASAEAQRNLRRIDRELRGPSGAEAKLSATRDELAAWASDWSMAVAELPLNPKAGPEEAAADLDRIAQVRQSLQLAEDLRGRIRQIDESCADFESTVRSLATQIAPALARIPPEQASAELTARLTQALQLEERQRLLRQKIDEDQQRAADAQVRIDQLRSQRDLLVGEAHCDRFEDLPVAEERSLKKREADERLAQCETRLRELTGGAPLDAFLEDCRSQDADSVEAELARLESEIADLSRQLTDELGEAIGAEKKVLDQMDSSGEAAAEAENVSDLVAKIATEAEEFARLSLARAVLRKGIERYRERHQGPILGRASELFSMLTCGSFSGLREDFAEDGHPVLVGIRASNGQSVPVGRMSDGTADQIYLAVRLAWLEEFVSRHESVPLIVDDVLIRFDDARALQTLSALAELSKKTQVLFFTHHRHLVDLARDKFAGDVVFTHQLPGQGA